MFDPKVIRVPGWLTISMLHRGHEKAQRSKAGTCCGGAVCIAARSARAERLLARAAQREAAQGGQESVASIRQAQQPRRLCECLVALRARRITDSSGRHEKLEQPRTLTHSWR